jgi:hypothetical protein
MPTKKSSRPPTKVLILIVVIIAELIGIAWFLSQGRNQPLPPPNTEPNQFSQATQEQQQATLSLSPSSGQLAVGDTQTLSINLSAMGQLINGADVIITFDPQLVDITDSDPSLEGIQIQPTSLFPLYPVNRVDHQTGRIFLSSLTQSPSEEPLHKKAPPPTLAQFSFTTLTTGTAQFDFIFTPGTATSTIIQTGTSKNILSDTQSATFQITP